MAAEASLTPRPPRPAFGLYRRAALGALLLVLCTGGAVATAALLQVKAVVQRIDDLSPRIAGAEVPGALDGVPAGKAQTIMLLGSDRRFGDGRQAGNSDTMVLLHLDPDRQVTSVMSIPRDLRVDVPGVGQGKVNSAYAEGGPILAVKTVRQLFAQAGERVPINHVVDIDFGGFTRAVDRLGCVWTDVDRRYFNDNDPPVDSPTDYAVIDVKAGYQKLCGKHALEYVRFRHLDSDIVRGARQQDFLRQAKDQIGVSRLLDDRSELLDIFARYTRTDIHDEQAILRLLKLVVVSAGNPLQEVRFDVQDAPDTSGDLLTSSEELRRAADRFLHARASTGTRGRVATTPADRRRARAQQRRSASEVPAGLYATSGEPRPLAARLKARTPFPVYYPRWAATGLVQYDAAASRSYSIRTGPNTVERAYRIVARTAGTGAYYGVQGTSWQDPPILDGAQKRRDRGGRTFEVIGDGFKYRLVAWRTPDAVYWVSNTLQLSLSNSQMLGIARSLTRVGR